MREMREREKKKEAEDAERLEKEDKVNAHLTAWKSGKEKNLRALLSSLEQILWTGIEWKGVTMTELLEPRKCKITYMKAIAKVHPDKVIIIKKLAYFNLNSSFSFLQKQQLNNVYLLVVYLLL